MNITKNINIHNPITEGWYADPESRFYEGQYWIYVTRSNTDYYKQLNLDAFSSTDLIHWEKHESIVDMEGFPWVEKAVWAPTIIEGDGKYYLIFAGNDIKNNDQKGGLAIAVSDNPGGPFKSFTDGLLIDRFINGAQPIDAHLFKADDGTIYLYYGGWKHCNLAVMNETMTGFTPDAGTDCVFREITPEGYVESPCVLKRKDFYYFIWSEGDWVDGSYRVCYLRSDTPLHFEGNKRILLQSDEIIADGPGHPGYLQIPGTDEWYLVYHRRIIGDLEAGHRMLCIDKLFFDKDDEMEAVKMTV